MLHCRHRAHAGRSDGAVKTSMLKQEGGAGRPAQEAAHLPSVGRDGGRGRRSPKGVVHGAATASQVGPSVGSRSRGGWIRKAGHCRARGESKAKTFRSTHTSRIQGCKGGSWAGVKGQGPIPEGMG